jgi:hypothetical protein
MAFMEGFSKPSYVVVTVCLDGVLPVELVRRALEQLVERHPLLRSTVERCWGFPARFRHSAVSEWLAAGGIHVDDDFDLDRLPELERRLLSTRIDVGREFPVHVCHLTGGSAGARRTVLVAKAHHAIVDAHTGRSLMADFASLCSAALTGTAAPPLPRRSTSRPAATGMQRLSGWLRGAELAPRVPAVSLVSDFTPRAPIERLPVEFRERLLTAGTWARISARASQRQLSASQAVCLALLRSMARYNEAASTDRRLPAPEHIGLMFAQSRRFRREDRELPEGFRADTHVLRLPRSWLSSPERSECAEAYVRRELRPQRGKHNDLALGALVIGRRLRRVVPTSAREAPAARVPAVHFTLSDLTAGATRIPALSLGGMQVASMRYLVSPVAAAHAGLLVQRYADQVRLSVIYHAGAIDADALLDHLLLELDVLPPPPEDCA